MAEDSHGMGIELPPDSTKLEQFPGIVRVAMERVAEILAGDLPGGVVDAINAAAGPAVDAEVAAADLVRGADPRLPTILAGADWLWVVTDDDDNVVGGFKTDGTFETGNAPSVATDDARLPDIVSYPGDWLWVATDAADNILFGVKSDGTFESYAAGTPESQHSVWPAVAYGDSTTAGADLGSPTTQRWSALLATAIGQAVENLGSSGAKAEEITARQGGISFTATVAGNSIPASGPVALSNLELDPLRSGEVTSYGVEIAGIAGTLTRPAGVLTFTRTAAGNATAVPATVDVYSTSGASRRGRVHIIGQGINNEPDIDAGTTTVDQLCEWYAAAISTLTPMKPRFIVWGLLDRGPAEGAGTARGTMIRTVETFLAKTYGAHFVNVRKYLASYRALAEAGITPTVDDDAAIAAKSVPPSLRSSAGSVHLNAAGHEIQANLFARHITKNGWL